MPFSPFYDFFDAINNEVESFNRLVGESRRQPRSNALGKKNGAQENSLSRWLGGTVDIIPPIDILEHEKEYEVHATIPGVASQDDIAVDYHKEQNELVISGQIPNKVTEKNKDGWRLREVASGSFRRVIALPSRPGVDVDNIQGDYNNGVLTLKIPKLKESPEKASVRRITLGKKD